MMKKLENYKRYEKHIIIKKIGVNGQKKILNSNVLIIGLGGLGCPLLTYLAASGVGQIGIVDNDKIEISNLNRQILFNPSDLGKFKVNEASKKIKKINNKIMIKPFLMRINRTNVSSILKKFDIICDGTDNYETRYLINDQCKKEKKILISAAIDQFSGHLYKFDFRKKGPCYRCFMPEKPIEEKNCQTEGIFSPVAGIMGSLQSNEVIKTILGFKNDLTHKMIIFDSIKTDFRSTKISINPKCVNKC